MRNARCLVLVFAAALVLAATRPAAAQVDADTDGDGVADSLDQCPDTPTGDLVDTNGCSVCPCDGTADGNAWTSHQAYIACVVGEVKTRRAASTMMGRAARAAIKTAKRSSCGNENLTRCCVYANFDDDVGSCHLMAPDACDALDSRLDDGEADDIGGGSCLGNPCAF